MAMDERLSLLAEMVQPCRLVADIGTDHGFLVCALVESGRAERGTAADINPQPLEKARTEIRLRGLQNQIETVLTDGLTAIDPQTPDAVVIAGMGGDLIARIIGSWAGSHRTNLRFYLQPMTKAERLRELLWNNGFEIEQERCCVAANRPYSVFQVCFTGNNTAFQEWELYLGRVQPQAGMAEQAYCRKILTQLTEKVEGHRMAASPLLPELEALLEQVKRRISE
jgi:tRNA (adenine22-N1)-methyltransferase